VMPAGPVPMITARMSSSRPCGRRNRTCFEIRSRAREKVAA
jgi:hypothetical protein